MNHEAHKEEKKIPLTMQPAPSLPVRTKWDASPDPRTREISGDIGLPDENG